MTSCSVLVSNLLDDNSDLPLLSPASVTTPTRTPGGDSGANFEVHLKAPSAYGIKVQQDKVTYLNRGMLFNIVLLTYVV